MRSLVPCITLHREQPISVFSHRTHAKYTQAEIHVQVLRVHVMITRKHCHEFSFHLLFRAISHSPTKQKKNPKKKKRTTTTTTTAIKTALELIEKYCRTMSVDEIWFPFCGTMLMFFLSMITWEIFASAHCEKKITWKMFNNNLFSDHILFMQKCMAFFFCLFISCSISFYFSLYFNGRMF